MVATHCFDTPFGVLSLTEEDGAITALSMPPAASAGAAAPTPLLAEAERQLTEYFAGRRQLFELPLAPRGTAFQQKVWKALCAIPYGETRSYRQVAEEVGCPRGYRAVGLANNRNPIAVLIPCHRVLGADGSLTGYAYGLEMKKGLLALEGCDVGG